MVSKLAYRIKTLPSYRAIGLKEDILYEKIEQISDVIEESIKKADELDSFVNSNERLGLSYHDRPDGFTYYSMYEVTGKQVKPSNMVERIIPEMTYVIVRHHLNDERIEKIYKQIDNWLEKSDYEPYFETDREYYDSLPIKHEVYYSDKDLIEIRIPITTSSK